MLHQLHVMHEIFSIGSLFFQALSTIISVPNLLNKEQK